MKKAIINKATILGFACFIGSLFLFGGIKTANAGPDIIARLNAPKPSSHYGSCPVTIKFDGVIIVRNFKRSGFTKNIPLKIQYSFTRSDGASGPIQTLTFRGNGSQRVHNTWRLGGTSLPEYSGWEAIKVISPVTTMSNKANFRIKCRTAGAATEAQRKPDLVIRSFGLKKWGKCEPNNVIFTFQVTVANIGTAPSPAISNKALVQAMDQHGNGWGNGVPLPAIPPGRSHTVTIPVYYLKGDPDHITGVVPHPFKAVADPLNLIDELKEDNNDSSRIINVDPRSICRQAQKPQLRPQPQPRPLPQPLPGPQAEVREDCISFNPGSAEVKNINGDWKIVDGSHWMFSFGNNKAEADKALRIIKRYRMNQSCFVGRPGPSFQYMLTSGNAPRGRYSGEDCIAFNPARAEVNNINGDWKIVDGSHWMFSFGNNESEARQALAIIKKYNFNYSCFVGRPQPSFKYLRR